MRSSRRLAQAAEAGSEVGLMAERALVRATGFVRHPEGPRLYLKGRRIHHGTAGIFVAAAALLVHQPRLAAIGLAMIAHDAGDFPWRDCDNHGSC